MKAILKYPGAKNRLAKWICSYIPQHKVYLEPFFGSGAVFFNKDACYNEIINDIDDDIYNFFCVLRNYPTALIEGIQDTPYSRTEYNHAYTVDTGGDSIERARLFAIKCWQGFGCGNRYKNGFRRGLGPKSPNPARAWAQLPDTLREATARLKNVQIENKDALELIARAYEDETFIFIDPPYLLSTRKGYLYNHEMSDGRHEVLLGLIRQKSCKIMICGYENNLYSDALKGWRKVTKNTTAECARRRTEVLWMNYDIEDLP